MMKQIQIHGQRIKLYSPDKGRTWSSSPRAIVAYDRRKKTARLDLKKGFETIDEIQDPDPNNFCELEIPKASSDGFDLVLLPIHYRGCELEPQIDSP